MRERAVLAGRDDRRERRVLGAQLADALVGGEHDLPLGPPDQAALEDPS